MYLFLYNNPVFFREILNGIAVTDENGNKLGHSTVRILEIGMFITCL